MVDETSGSGDATEQATKAEVPSWFAEFSAQVDRRFEGLAAKLKSPSSEQSAKTAAQESDVGEIVKAAMSYGELRSGLSEGVRAKLDALQEQGLSYAQLSAVAETLRMVRAPANGSATAERSAPTGLAATPAHSSTAPSIRTISELRALRGKSPEAYKAWLADPANDPSKLQNR